MTIASTGAERLRLGVAAWASETTNPNAGAGTSAALGSLWQRNGSYPARPTQLYSKVATADKGWVHENLVNLNVFNVKTYGAIGNGIHDDTASFQAAVDAAQTAGGGVVYVPPVNVNAGEFYKMTKVGAGPGVSINLANRQNITLLGDGYASLVKMSGDSGGGDWHMIRMFDGTQAIRIYNLNLDGGGVTNPDPGAQNHVIQCFGAQTVGHLGTKDVDIAFNFISGSSVGDFCQNIGNSNTGTVEDIRLLYNAQDVSKARSFTEAQRYTKRIQVHFNWIRGTPDNDIDFEPTGALAVPPMEWSILGNQIDHQSHATASITLAGIGSAIPNTHCLCAYNIINNGGDIQGNNVAATVIKGNIVTVNSTAGDQVLRFFDLCVDLLITGNVAVSQNNAGTAGARAAVGIVQANGHQGAQCIIEDNILSTIDGRSIDLELNEGIANGNVCVCDNAVDGSASAIFNDSINAELDHFTAYGNLVLGITARINIGINYAADGGNNVRNTSASFNFIRHCATGIFWSRATTETQTDWRIANANNIVDESTASVVITPTTNPITLEGSAGPGVQWDQIGVAAGPAGNVAAPKGSMCVSTVGGSGVTLFYKESAVGVSGGTAGWVGVGGMELALGAKSLSTATASRFLAPGGQGLLVETTVAVAIAMPRAGTLRNARLRCVAGTGGSTVQFVGQVNGVDNSLGFTVNNTSTTGNNTSNTKTVTPGDLVSFVTRKGSAPTTPQTNVQLTLELA